MRIQFDRSGGFANIPLRGEIDSAQIPPERKTELEKLVERARPFDQPARPQNLSPVPDDYQYDVTIEDDARTHTFRIADSAASDDLKLLFDFLVEEALRKTRG